MNRIAIDGRGSREPVADNGTEAAAQRTGASKSSSPNRVPDRSPGGSRPTPPAGAVCVPPEMSDRTIGSRRTPISDPQRYPSCPPSLRTAAFPLAAHLVRRAGCPHRTGRLRGLGRRDPVRVNLVGLEPLQGEGFELRFAVRLRVQNPNDSAIDYDGVALELDVNDKSFATGVSDSKGSVPRFGETVISVPVTVSAICRTAPGTGPGRRCQPRQPALRRCAANSQAARSAPCASAKKAGSACRAPAGPATRRVDRQGAGPDSRSDPRPDLGRH
jgi:hypothetical protein